MPVLKIALSKLASAVGLLFTMVTVLFLLLQLAPGDPVQVMIGGYPVSDEYRAMMEAKYGLDLPIWQRYFNYLAGMVTLDFGYSFSENSDIAPLVMNRLGNTLILAVVAYIVATVFGLLFGIVSALYRGRPLDTAARFFSIAGFSFPTFFLGQLLILVFSVNLMWFPVSGMYSGFRPETQTVGDLAWHLVLPVIALAVRDIGLNARITRASMLQTLGQDYMVTARAKGLGRKEAIVKHGIKNSLLPITTTLGVNFAYFMGGSVLIETVFAWPGMGRLLYSSIGARDTMVVVSACVIMAAIVIVVNTVTDLVYSRLDPRIRTRGK